ncbi:MAG: LysM peptidoglycan-binding domain-containing protein [Acidobacteria bacterium]|nr:LysM peptidoglycan-binding domain-containing protein [Acidobacteriota bacterium]
MNSLQDLINLLTDAIKQGGGNLTLPVNNLPESTTLVGYFQLDTLTINNAKLSSTASEVTVVGTTSISTLNLTNVQATLTGQVVNQATLLQLQVYSLGANWNLTTSFPNLPVSEDFSSSKGTYFLKNSYFGELVLSSPAFTASTFDDTNSNYITGLNFTAGAAVTGPFQQIAHLISSVKLLDIYGGITMQKTDPPLFDLRADLPGFNFNLGQISMTDVHLTMTTDPPADDGEVWTSSLGIAGTISVGTTAPIAMTISSALQNTGIWVFTGVPVGKSTQLANGLADLSALISGSASDLQIPTVGKVFSLFYLSKVSVMLSATDSSVQSIFVSVTSTDPWVLPLPGFTINQISTGWTILNPLVSTKRSISGYVSGIFVFGEEQVGLQVTALVPNFILTASLVTVTNTDDDATALMTTDDPPEGIHLRDVLTTLTGSDGGIPDFIVTEFDLMLDPNNNSYSLATAIYENWTLPVKLGRTTLTFERMTFSIAYNQTSLSGKIASYFNILSTDFMVSAEKPAGDNGWIFSGEMLSGQQLTLQTLATGFLPEDWNVTLPKPLDTLALTTLSASFNTKDNTYALAAGFTWLLDDLVPNYTFEIDANFSLQSICTMVNNVATYSYNGSVSGVFKVNSLTVTVSYQFQSNNSTLSFSINFRGTTLSCSYSTKTVAGQTQKVLTVSIGNLNVGEMIEYLVNLADPSSNFKLSSPWDVLNDISMKNLSLEINLTTNDISIAYTPTSPLDLIIIKLSFIKLTYRKTAGQGSVNIELGGDFLGQEYTSADPLKWDMLNDQPPATPGAGAALLDMEYLGIGQHIALDTTNLNNVTQVINALEAMLQPVDDPSKNPLTQLQGLSFSQNSNWLIGTRFTVMGTVTIAVIFNDPQIYGLLIALGGEKAKSFAGLQFEILYKKVTDTIGVYHIELKLPDAMRHLEFGEVSVTLPIIVLDIYTNGNFKVDFGFPWNVDFSRSFSVQVFPFVGYGGFYFAYLNGDTSTSVPKITNGNFNPVIEFGIGLSLGVGKTINEGVFSAGASVTVQGILQGVLGWFNPNDNALPKEMYYWIQGTISIVGKVYGTVDFVIISVSISITVYASATLTIECYQPILISLSAGVSVTASVKILFIRIHFSFSMQINLSFTIGHASPTPWIKASSGGQQLQQAKAMSASRAVLKAASFMAVSSTSYSLVWNPVNVFGGTSYTLQMFIVPAFTVAVQECIANPITTPQVQAVMLPFVENSLPTTPTSSKDIRTINSDTASELPFNRLAHALLAWSIYALTQGNSTTIKADGLDYIYDQMMADDAGETIFAYQGSTIYQNLSNFIGNNFTFQITGTSDSSQNAMSATIFPIMPDLVMTAGNNAPIDFSLFNQVDQNYEEQLAEYFKERMANADANNAQDPLADQNGSSLMLQSSNEPAEESLATVIFKDYFFMVAKAGIQAAQDAMNTYQYAVQSGDKLTTIVDNFPSGATTVEQLAVANADVTLQQNTLLTNIGLLYGDSQTPVVKYQIKSGDTLASIAASFNGNTGIVTQNLSNDSIFQLTAVVNYPASQYTTQSGDTLDFVAAYYLVRNLENGSQRDLRWFTQLIIDSNNSVDFRLPLTNGATLQMPQFTVNPQGLVVLGNNTTYIVQSGDTLASIAEANLNAIAASLNLTPQSFAIDPVFGWFEQAIVALSSQNANNQNVDFTGILPFGTVMTIPVIQLTSAGVIQPPNNPTFNYTSRNGDTVGLIAGYFLLTQVEQSLLTPMETNIKNANPGATFSPLPATLNIPMLQHQIDPADSFAILETLFDTTVDVATANNQSAGLLTPLAILDIPNVTHPIAAGETLTKIAAIYNFTVDDFAVMIEDVENIFVASTAETPAYITIPALQEINIQELLTYMVNNGDFNNMAGMVSRFMLHGMRIPQPPPAGEQLNLTIQHFKDGLVDTGTLCPLYQMTGQQFAAPPSVPESYDITFVNKGQASWIEFLPTGTYTLPSEQTLAQIAQTLGVPAPQIVALNPNVDFNQPVPQGTLLNVPSGSLVVQLTSTTPNDYPSATFSPNIQSGPSPMVLAQEAPARYSLTQNYAWQVPDNSLFAGQGSGQLAGQPSMWLFPDNLLSKVEALASPTQFDLQTGSYTTGAVMNTTPVQAYYWATALKVNIRQIDSEATKATMPGSYLVLGSDQAGNDLLREVYDYLTTPKQTDKATLYLLYQPNPASANSNGLASDLLDTTNTFVLKTNLSTETHSGPQLLMASEMVLEANIAAPVPESGDYYANIAASQDFMQFLWQASIVGTGGFYLNYATQSGGIGLPGSVFSNGTDATLWLVILLSSQTTPGATQHQVYSFNNCAIIDDNINTSKVNLFAERTDGTDLVPYTTVAAGNLGFELTRPNPDQAPESPTQLTQALYNLLGFEIVGDTLFSDSGEMPPVGPTQDDPNSSGGMALPQNASTDDTTWRFQQVVPIYKFALLNNVPQVSGLPSPTENPYAGITKILSGQQYNLGSATFSFAFQDVYGNRTPPDVPINNLPIPVGYFDTIIGLSQWPGTASTFEFTGAGGKPILNIEIGLDISKYVPNAGNPYTNAVYSASSHQQRYKQLYYQVQQKQISGQTETYDLTFYLSTTMSQQSSSVLPTRYEIEPRYLLSNFINSAYVFLNTAMWWRAYNYSLNANDTFATIAKTFFGVDAGSDPATLEAIATANQNTAVANFLASDIAIPNFYVVAQGDSLQTINERTGFAIDTLVQQNESAPLNAGTDIALPNRTVTLQFTDDTDNTLANVAASANVLATVGGLAVANLTSASLLAKDTPFTYQGFTVKIGDTVGTSTIQTFQDLVNYFANALQGKNVSVTAEDIAVANQTVQGVFVEGATLTIADYVFQTGDTIESVLAYFKPYPQIGLEQLISTVSQGVPNSALPNYFAAGTPLYLNSTTQSFSDTDTLVSIAAENHLTLQQLAFYNAGTALKETASLTIPNLVYIEPNLGRFYSFYETTGSETFQQIAQLFNAQVSDMANDNQNQTGIFAPQQTIKIIENSKPYSVTTGDYDTFNTLIAAFAAQGLTISLGDFAAAIQTNSGLIAEGGFLTMPLPQVQATATSGGLATTKSLAQIAEDFQPAYVKAAGLAEAVSNLGLANSALKGFLQAGATVYPNQTEASKQGVTLQTAANDTFVSLVTRFLLETGITTTVDDIVTANQNLTTLVAPDAAFMLPPISAIINQTINAQFPDIIFPVSAKLEMERDDDLIDAGFKQTLPTPNYDDVSGAELDRSTIAPRTTTGAGQSLNLGDFAVDFETNAFPGLKIATGKSQSEAQTQSGVPPLWAVNFSTGGFSQFEIQSASPSFYAVKPLSTQLQSRSNVPIQPYANGALEAAKAMNFQAIDLDVWVRDFLAAVDLFLSPEYAVPAYTLDPTHAAYTSVVTSKGSIANAVSASVDFILNQNQTESGNPALEAAQQALLQQLLINLSNGYATDAIIQYPVNIQSPYTDADTTPRISGTPVSMMYLTGASDVISTIAKAYTVSNEYVTELLANTQRILNSNATLSLNNKSATMVMIADWAQLSLDAVALQTIANYYNQFFPTTLDMIANDLQVTGGGGLFMANTVINISQIKKPLTAADSFDSLAEYFNQTITQVAIANQYLQGIFSITSLTASNQTVPVTAQDSLYSVGQKFNPVLTADALANEIAGQSNLFNPQSIFSMIQVVPDYTLSTAKTPLINNGAMLTFMFNTKTEALYKKLFFDLNYVMNEMEYDIQAGGSNISDYQASSWLSFIIPIDSTVSSLPNISSQIGQVEVPIPLRSYPTPPSLVSQESVTEYPEATTVGEAKLWDYRLTYERQDAAQDTDYMTVTFNTTSVDNAVKNAASNSNLAQLFDALFNALAQFSSVYPAVKNDLAVLPTLKPGAPNPLAVSAMNVFQQIVNGVAKAWENLVNASNQLSRMRLGAMQGLIEFTYNYSLESTIAPDGNLASLTVKQLDAMTTAFPENVYVYTTNKAGQVIEYQLTTSSEAEANETEKTFYYPDGTGDANPVAALGSVKQIFEFAGLDMVLVQNAWGGVYVTRNENLVSYAPTSQTFIYQTPLARFSNMMIPLVQNTSCINITATQDPTDFAKNLTDSLNQMFTELFSVDASGTTHDIKIACQYGYQVVSSSSGANPCGNPNDPLTSLVSRLPVLFVPKYPYALNNADLVNQIVTYIVAWSQQASSAGGLYIFEVSLFSTLDPQLTQPLLELKNLVYQPPTS